MGTLVRCCIMHVGINSWRKRMDHVFHRHTQHVLPLATRGDGPYVIDANGKRYLDALGQNDEPAQP